MARSRPFVLLVLVAGLGRVPVALADEKHDSAPFAGLVGAGITFSHGLNACEWVIDGVWPGSPGAAADLREGDVILEFAGIDFSDCSKRESIKQTIRARLQSLGVGAVASIVVRRDGKRIQAPLRLGDLQELLEIAERLEKKQGASPEETPTATPSRGKKSEGRDLSQ